MSRAKPGQVRAGLLALSVHILFFIFLAFGVSWQRKPPQIMEVAVWQSLPARPASTPAAEPEPPPLKKNPPKAAEPAPAPRPDIALKAKQEAEQRQREEQTKQQAQRKKAEEEKRKQEEKQRIAAQQAREAAARKDLEDAARRQQEARQATQSRIENDYKARIQAKIHRFTIIPPDLTGNPQAEYQVTLLPGGDVLSAKLVKSSGSPAYDAAVERAIYKAQPLPLPPDPALFPRFRELVLQFRPQS